MQEADSMVGPNDLARMVPGFDFLQGLLKNAGAGLPAMGQWVAPTLNPEELEKRIQELKTVQFWLEQNARLLAGTIQALEVQRMTLSTLKTMNLSFGDLAESLKIKPAAEAPAAATAPPQPAPAASPTPEPSPAPSVPTGVVDPMQWWGALTKQFAEIASNTLKDSSADVAKNLANAVVQQGVEAASESFKAAAAMPGQMAQQVAAAAGKAVAGGVAKTAGKAAATRLGAKAAPKAGIKTASKAAPKSSALSTSKPASKSSRKA
jgi:hypothetical protein